MQICDLLKLKHTTHNSFFYFLNFNIIKEIYNL